MANTYMTPGVYIEEKNAFPGSAVAVETAVPVFIGYTEKADRKGKSLLNKPTRITSLAMFSELFGAGIKSQFTITDPTDDAPEEERLVINGLEKVVKFKDNNRAMLYNAIRLFYSNGGSACYILPVGTYGGNDRQNFEIKISDFQEKMFATLEKEYEPTLVVLPDIILKGVDAYPVYQQVLMHCQKMQNRFALFDVFHTPGNTIQEDVDQFRNGIGGNALNYGAAYYPFLKTSVVQPTELDILNLDLDSLVVTKEDQKKIAKGATADQENTDPPAGDSGKGGAATNGSNGQSSGGPLESLLPESKGKEVVTKTKERFNFSSLNLSTLAELGSTDITNFHQSLKASSPTYTTILEEMRRQLNELPPSAAIAGVYTYTDTTRGVWKSPANISVSMVNEPALNISQEEQQNLNVDAITGKSINVIRSFPGLGTLVWGARTLDGNSQDWRYVNVRRTLIMIEQSIKLATRAYVFEANDANTWVTVTSMINNFLYNLWKQGALAGATPDQAYNVQLGLGSTMTPNDILDGIMRISIHLAIVRPAEFIVITFQQQQQQS